MQMSSVAFDQQFARFKTVIKTSTGQEFNSFNEGIVAQEEGYKERVRDEAILRLETPSWTASDVGTGKILERVIRAIEINEHPIDLRNNLVAWPNKFGHEARPHRKLLDARGNAFEREEFEQWFLDFAHDACPDAELFDQFRALAGNRYDLIAYLFFLKDWTRFMPIGTTTFDTAFRLLEIPLVTAHRCSWENYCEFNDALRAVRQQLIERTDLVDARLIDAHSFCWVLVRLGNESTGGANRESTEAKEKHPREQREIRDGGIEALNQMWGASSREEQEQFLHVNQLQRKTQ